MSSLIELIGAPWRWLEDLGATLKPCRFSAIVVAVAGIGLIVVPQAQEALRGLAERNEYPDIRLLQWRWFFLSAVFWAWNSWYWARQMLNVKFPSTPPITAQRERLRRHVPRALGVIALLAVFVALWRAGVPYRDSEVGEAIQARSSLNAALIAAALLAVAFYAFVRFRRKLFTVNDKERVATVRSLPRVTWWVLALSAGVAFLFFVLFTSAPVSLAPKLGTPAIFLFAAGTWIPLGSICVYAGSRWEFPVLSLLLIAVILFGTWNDNHGVRVVDGALPKTPVLPEAASKWLEARRPELTAAQAEHRKYPVFVVAAAGGGIRAAYWTAVLLSGLDDHFGGKFSQHTFGISGVSGGSVGAATFVSLLAEQKLGRLRGCQQKPAGQLRWCASAVMSQDFLAPVAAALLYPDLTQRFLPFAVPAFDRARALEGSWEQAWRDQGMDGDRLAQPFDALWENNFGNTLPLLFLNSTVVESGRRAIASPTLVPDFQDALDLNTELMQRIPLSTAAHLSARFTYVSPAASLRDAHGRVAKHLVDGGYYENAGVSTAKEVMDHLTAAAQQSGFGDVVCTHLIVVSNAPGYVAGGSQDGPPIRFLTEVLAPIEALFNARDAHSAQAEAGAAVNHQSMSIGLQQRVGHPTLPLGWMLSDLAQHEIDEQLTMMLNATKVGSPVLMIAQILQRGCE